MTRSFFNARAIALLTAGALFVAAAVLRPAAGALQDASVTIVVDASGDIRPISPLIYGVAHATASELSELNAPLHRLGGNYTSRYNWQQNAYNRGMDWYFESVGEPGSVAGDSADAFVGGARAAGAQALLTVPMLDWVAKLGPNRGKLASFSIAKYGPQTGNDWQWFPDAGNGVRTTGGYVTGNDPNDANVPAGPAFQQSWVEHLRARWGPADAGGVRYYAMDNEPSLWFETHRDVRPIGATMTEVRDRFIDYASMVKDVDPGARIIGPEEWGWVGYFYSGYDQQWARANGWGGSFPDRSAHGGWDYLPWLLDQWRRHEAATGRRVLDVFSVHYYPQGGEYSSTATESVQRLRNRSTRSLWDPNYVDESWIGTRVQLIPRLRTWVNTHYAPGTPIAITEYSWGAEGHISGALAQADVLGIFGREGLDMAARWATPDPSTPTFKAMKMFRNYDGHRSAFGDTSVRAAVPNPDELAAFAALRSVDGALTVMVLNKSLAGSTPVTVTVAGFSPASAAEQWQLTADNVIRRLADVPLAGNAIAGSLPRQSVTLFVVPGAGEPPPPPVATLGAPSGLTARVAFPLVTLRWTDHATNETGFTIERRVSRKGTWEAVGWTAANITVYSETASRGTYEYRVRAVNNSTGQASGYSNAVSVRVR